MDAVADAFFGALEEGSIDKVNACFAPGGTIWHNFDQKTITPEENVPGLQHLFSTYSDLAYVQVRRQPTPVGFVQQHLMRLKPASGGAVIEWPGCVICEVSDGKITRLEEYVDLASLAVAS